MPVRRHDRIRGGVRRVGRVGGRSGVAGSVIGSGNGRSGRAFASPAFVVVAFLLAQGMEQMRTVPYRRHLGVVFDIGHQSVEFEDIGAALRALRDAGVPILDDLDGFRTTRPGIEDALALHAEVPLSDHLEIETYTWDALPSHLKTGDIVDYVVREWTWLREQLQT
jgi:hypothetical protein